MKNIFLIVCLFFLNILFAQEDNALENISLYKDFVFKNENNINYNERNLLGNTTLIYQIGNNNNSEIHSVNEQSLFTVYQNGDNNDSFITRNGTNIDESIYQIGNSNTFYDYSVLPSNDINLNFNQTGNNLSIYNSGANSISNSMIINQTGSDQTIIILNN